MFVLTFPILLLLSTAAAQHADDNPENHPKLTTWKCSREHGCTPQQTAIVMDSLKRPIYQVNATSLNCGSDRGSPPNTTVCPDVNTCQANCAMGGIEDYSTAGVSTDGGSLHLDMLRDDDLFKLSPRVYLLSENEESYEMLRLVGQELAFDVDASKLPCGMNGALYLSEMEETGGLSNVNTAGPAYGTGYCDAQCYITPFINGEVCICSKKDVGGSTTNKLLRQILMGTGLAAMSLIYGRQTLEQLTWPLTRATLLVCTNAKTVIAPQAVCATSRGAPIILMVWATTISTASTRQWTHAGHSQS